MRNLLLLFASLLLWLGANATHIVGGVMSVQHKTGKVYQITLRVYRDCLNGEAPFDDPAPVGIFDIKTNVLKATYQVPLISQENLPFAAASCNSSLPLGCTEVGLYQLNIQLDTLTFNNKDGYYLSYQRCCRNGIIQNIQDPGGDGIAIYAEIPSPKYVLNSTPSMSQNPNILLCQDKLTTYNFGFKDSDGDELRYSMTSPLRGNLSRTTPQDPDPSSGPYPETMWASGFSNAEQIIGNPSLIINAVTGEIKVSPAQTGTFAIAIKVEEYRQNIKIGEVILELQFNVAPCFQPKPQIMVKDSQGKFVTGEDTIQTPNSACFEVTVTDPSDSLYITIQNASDDTTIFPLPVFERKIDGYKTVKTFICWEAACSLPANAVQKITIDVIDNGCPKFATATYVLQLRTLPMPNTNPTDLLCMTLADDKQTTLYWGDSTPLTPTFKQYNLYRSVNSGPFELLDSIPNKTTRSYVDLNTPNYSSINYQYMMRSVNQCGKIGLPSDTLGTFEQLKFIPDTQQIISVSVVNNKSLQLTWPKTWEKDFAQYSVYKKANKPGSFSLLYQTHNINDTTLQDKDVDVSAQSYCYYVVMKDTCDNIGPVGDWGCSILLTGKSESYKNNISWNAYNWWRCGTKNYEVQSLGNEMRSANRFIVSSEDSLYDGPPIFEDDNLDPSSNLFNYVVIAHQNDVAISSYMLHGNKTETVFYNAQSVSNEITLSQKPYLFVPNAFTPNNDNINDTWDIKTVFIKDYKLSVYNKWGQLVFSTNDKNDKWTGTFSSGAFAPSDVYVYLITYTGRDDSSFTTKGNVTVLR